MKKYLAPIVIVILALASCEKQTTERIDFVHPHYGKIVNQLDLEIKNLATNQVESRYQMGRFYNDSVVVYNSSGFSTYVMLDQNMYDGGLVSHTYGSMNGPASILNFSDHEHDENNNLIRFSRGEGFLDLNFEYDQQNRLAQVSSGNTIEFIYEYISANEYVVKSNDFEIRVVGDGMKVPEMNMHSLSNYDEPRYFDYIPFNHQMLTRAGNPLLYEVVFSSEQDFKESMYELAYTYDTQGYPLTAFGRFKKDKTSSDFDLEVNIKLKYQQLPQAF